MKRMEILMEKLQRLNEQQLNKIPDILGLHDVGEEFNLNLEEMSDVQLSKLERYCDVVSRQ